MLKDKDKLKEKLKSKMNKEIDKYVDAIDNGFYKDEFSIDEIETLWGNAIKGCNLILQEGTETMLNSVNESEIISKKKTVRWHFKY